MKFKETIQYWPSGRVIEIDGEELTRDNIVEFMKFAKKEMDRVSGIPSKWLVVPECIVEEIKKINQGG